MINIFHTIFFLIILFLPNWKYETKYFQIEATKCVQNSAVKHLESRDTIYAKVVFINKEEIIIERVQKIINENLFRLPDIHKQSEKSRIILLKHNYVRNGNKIYGDWESSKNILNRAILNQFDLIQENENSNDYFSGIGLGGELSHFTIEKNKKEIVLYCTYTFNTSAFITITDVEYIIKEISESQTKQNLNRYMKPFYFNINSD